MVGIDVLSFGANVSGDESANRLYLGIGNVPKPSLAATLHSAPDNLLLRLRVANSLALDSAANVRLVDFYRAAELFRIRFLHGLTDSMIQIPGGLVTADAQVALELHRADTPLRV